MKYNPYFLFDGHAEEATNLYAKAFNGEVQMMKFKDAPPNPNFTVPEELMERVMHSEVRFNDLVFMLCDSSPMEPVTNGNNVQVSIIFDEIDELTKVFDVLSIDGNIAMAPGETFFAKYYTMFTDKFGVTWQFIVQK